MAVCVVHTRPLHTEECKPILELPGLSISKSSKQSVLLYQDSIFTIKNPMLFQTKYNDFRWKNFTVSKTLRDNMSLSLTHFGIDILSCQKKFYNKQNIYIIFHPWTRLVIVVLIILLQSTNITYCDLLPMLIKYQDNFTESQSFVTQDANNVKTITTKHHGQFTISPWCKQHIQKHLMYLSPLVSQLNDSSQSFRYHDNPRSRIVPIILQRILW